MQTLFRNRFLVLGRAGMDLYADPPGTRIEEAQGFAAHLGGSAANIAVALARQGVASALLTRVSADAVGDYCRAELLRYGDWSRAGEFDAAALQGAGLFPFALSIILVSLIVDKIGYGRAMAAA